MNTRNIGKQGENICKKYLLDNDYKIVKQNYFTNFGEIDIIAEKDNLLVFVEVKYTKVGKFGNPVFSVNKSKRKRIYLSSEDFLQKYPQKKDIRFDIITIEKNNSSKLTHYENAFMSYDTEVL